MNQPEGKSGQIRVFTEEGEEWQDPPDAYVWVVEPNEYDMYGVEGVYATLEGAKASLPGYEWKPSTDDEPDVAADWISITEGRTVYTISKMQVGP